MAHWLDDAAAGLSEGRYSRRQILRRGAAVAGGALVASVTWPLAARGAGVPCPDFNSPCFAPDACCDGKACCDPATELCCNGHCFKRAPDLGCCHSSTYDPTIEKCCPHGSQACFKNETCCGKDHCCTHKELCCNGHCFKRAPDLGCCHNSTYDPSIEKCCPHGHQACFKNETCCGQEDCCKHGETCCGGKCCGKGHHCVQCGSGKKLCCPAGEYCCNGVCCKPKNCKHGVCQGKGCNAGPPCKAGEICCPQADCCPHGSTCCGNNCCRGGLCCTGNCSGPAAAGITCCPNGGATAGPSACSGTGYSGMGGCRGGKLGCFCDNGAFCPADTGCCNVFGDCLDPCP